MHPRPKRTLLTIIASLLLTQLAVAHGDLQHVLGTVTEASPTSLTVRTTDNKTVVVDLDSETEFTKAGAKITVPDIKPGDRVVIHAKKNGDKLVARTVQIGAAKAHS